MLLGQADKKCTQTDYIRLVYVSRSLNHIYNSLELRKAILMIILIKSIEAFLISYLTLNFHYN